jgi:hypothetical protein
MLERLSKEKNFRKYEKIMKIIEGLNISKINDCYQGNLLKHIVSPQKKLQ